MKLEEIGYTSELGQARLELGLAEFGIGRVIAENRERYIVRTESGDYEAEITGNMRFTAQGREDFPAVGDWVAVSQFDDLLVIQHILPRYSTIQRQAVGRHGEIQIIATNIDFALLVQAADRDFNLNRLERYLTICNSAGVQPIIVLSKTDLLLPEEIETLVNKIKTRLPALPVFPVSNETGAGYEDLVKVIRPGITYCMLGSSGVGKSTLTNRLCGKLHMKTEAISESTQRGRHITSHRELVILENGAIMIDNPGMREVGIADSTGGLELTFDLISELAADCRFKDCTHTSETGCAVIAAMEDGKVDPDAYDNYMKMQREKAHYEATQLERKQKDKKFGKFMKNFKKDGYNKRNF